MGQRWTFAAFFLLFAAFLFFFNRHAMFYDPGTFWHIATGERILQTGFLDTDPFSYTFAGSEWIPTQWLAECLLALQHRLLGLQGVLWAAITLLAALYAWLAQRFVRNGCPVLLAILIVGLILSVSSYHFHVRPHLITIALLGWVFALLVDVEAGRRQARDLCWLIPVFVVWTNIHGGMLAGLGTLGVTVVGWVVCRRAAGVNRPVNTGRSPFESWRTLVLFASLIVICAATALVNPYGWRLPLTWYVILQADLPDLIMEHAPLDPTDTIGIALLALGACYVVLLPGVPPRQWRVTWFVPLVWFVLAWTRVRHGPLFAIVTGVALADMLPHCPWLRFLYGGADISVCPGASRKACAPVPVGLLLVPVALFLAPLCLGQSWLNLDTGHWPTPLVDDLRQHAEHDGGRIFHDDLYGGFLIYYVPEMPVFVDDRYELYGRAFIQAYADALRREPHQLDVWQKQYGFNLALTRTEGTFTRHLKQSADWRLVRETPAACLFVAESPSRYTNAAGRHPKSTPIAD